MCYSNRSILPNCAEMTATGLPSKSNTSPPLYTTRSWGISTVIPSALSTLTVASARAVVLSMVPFEARASCEGSVGQIRS